MNKIARRLLAYGAASVVCAALGWGGFVYKVDAELMTLVNGAEMRLRLASSLPAKDRAGKPVSTRADLVRQARGELDKAASREGETVPIAELRAFALWVDGDCEAAAAAYGRIQSMPDCSPEMRDGMILNESRMWRAAGAPERAISALAKQAAFGKEQKLAAEIERLHALADAGRRDEAKTLAMQLAFAEPQTAAARLEAGQCLQRLQDFDAAERAFELVQKQDREGTYALALLKLVRGQVDRSLDLLEDYVRNEGERAKAKIRADRASWQAVIANERFDRITAGAASAPVPGR